MWKILRSMNSKIEENFWFLFKRSHMKFPRGWKFLDDNATGYANEIFFGFAIVARNKKGKKRNQFEMKKK